MPTKRKCVKCKNFAQISICVGCQQPFCVEHMLVHREDLSRQINNIDKDYDHFKESLNGQEIIQSLLSHIDSWEHDSIETIKKTAESARNGLLKVFDRMKNEFKSTCDQIKSDIQSNRELNNYSEINLDQWIEQLERLRQIHKTSFTNDIISDSQSSIRLIKIIDTMPSISVEQLRTYAPEKFNKITGKITLSTDRLTATCSERYWNGSNISGHNLYSTGIHSIRFQIKKKGNNNIFFGITSSAKALNPYNRKTPYAYGWWDFPWNTYRPEDVKEPGLQSGDELTLVLDCVNNQIQLEHHRTNQFLTESIEREQCPFPWRIAIVLYNPGDVVSILS